LPLAWLGWHLARQKRRTFLPSLLGSVAVVAIFTFSAFQDSVAFEYIYPTPLSKVLTFTALIMGGLWAFALHLLAIPAWLRHAENGIRG